MSHAPDPVPFEQLVADVRSAVALVVVAHPDDESFGLGAIVAGLVDAGVEVHGLCFTHGEASTLGAVPSLGRLRAAELSAATAALGMTACELGSHPDGGLAAVGLDALAAEVTAAARRSGADLLVVFDVEGITGHPDHRAATAAAVQAAHDLDLTVVAWTLHADQAALLDGEFDAGFVGRPGEEIDLTVVVDRSRQRRAISCHASQSTDNPVLARRLEICGDVEHLRWLRLAGART